jgi:succinoglycan biosynthesis protein ExoM
MAVDPVGRKLLVSVATYRRPEMLRRLLDSLFPAGIGDAEVDVLIVDNDPDRSAVEALAQDDRVQVVSEPRPGIPYARNAGLDHFSPEYFGIVFADDDEWAAPGWIDALLAAQRQTGAAVVAGFVKTVGEGWAQVIQRPKRPHLVSQSYAATNNALLTRAGWEAAGKPRFDPDFADVGSEDSDFFIRLHQAGANIVFAADAVLYEDWPAAANNWKAIVRRYVGQGQGHWLIARKHRKSRLLWWLRAVAESLGCAVFTLADLVRGRGRTSGWLRRWLFATGKVVAPFAPAQRLYRQSSSE